jgi:hypothetical protein
LTRAPDFEKVWQKQKASRRKILNHSIWPT